MLNYPRHFTKEDKGGLECGQEGMGTGNECIGLSREDRVTLYLAGEGGSSMGGEESGEARKSGNKRSEGGESSATKPKPSKPKKRRRI